MLPAVALLFSAAIPQGSSDDRFELFADGATIVWLGDSITHSCLFTQYLETWAFCRYPRHELTFVNCGVNGDRVQDALLRYERDVAPWKPTRVVVCLGMNDGGFAPFHRKRFTEFQKHMQLLFELIGRSGAETVVVSPPPVDPTHAQSLLERLTGLELPSDYGRVLNRYSEWLADESQRRGAVFVDVLAPLSRAAQRLKLQNPAATLIPDRIHPGYVGSALMALCVLDGVGEPGGRFDVTLARNGDGWTARAAGATAGEIDVGPGGIRFTLAAESLPWVLPAEALGVAMLDARFARRNRALLRYRGLEDRDWTLLADGIEVVTRSARQWARGVDLGLLARHPDWQQSRRVAAENARRNSLIRIGVRDLWRGRKEIALMEAQGKQQDPAYAAAQARVRRMEASLAEIGAKILQHDAAIRRLARPAPRVYDLKPER